MKSADFFMWLYYIDRVKRIWYLSPMRAAKVQASLRIRAVSPEPSLLAHTSSESRGTFRQKARSLAPLNGWACAVKICHDGMLEDTNSLDAAHMTFKFKFVWSQCLRLAVQLMYDLLLAVSALFFFTKWISLWSSDTLRLLTKYGKKSILMGLILIVTFYIIKLIRIII